MKTRLFFTFRLLIGISLLTAIVPGEGQGSVASAARAPGTANGYSLEGAAADSNIVYVCSSSNIGRTNDFSALSPDWTNITPLAMGTLHDCVPDPWKPQEKMWAVSTNGIWKGENLNTATPLWTQLRTTDQIRSDTDGFTQNGSEPDRIIPSLHIPGTVFVLYSHGGLGGAAKTWVGRSTDDGLTWSWNKVADDGSQARDFGFAIWQNANSPDAVTVWASARLGHLYTSTDGGQTFQRNLQLPPSNFYQLHTIYAPVTDTVGSILYVADGSGVGGAAYIYRTLDGGATWTNIAPVGGDSEPRGPLRQYEIAGPPSSSTHLYALVQRPQDVVGENKKLYYSADGGAAWTLRYDFAAWPFDVLGIGLNALDENRLYVLRQELSGAVSDTLIYSSNDGGTTWNDKSGNWKSNVGDWTGAVGVWDASVTPIESPLPGRLASLDLMASPVYADNQPIILSRWIHNLANAPKTYTFRVSLLQDGNVVEAKPEEQVNVWGSMTDVRTNISFGMRPIGRYEIRAELKLGADVIDNASLSVHVLSAGQQEAYLNAGGLKYFAMAELDQIGDIVTDRYVDALTAAASEGADLVINVIMGPLIKSLSPVGDAAGLSEQNIAKATVEIEKEVTDITNWLNRPVESLTEGFVRPHVDERLTPQVEAINARQEAFNAFVASRVPLTWTVDMSAWTLTYASYISSRVEEEPISLARPHSDLAITNTLWKANQQFDWMVAAGKAAGWVVVGLSVLILIVAALGLTPETLGASLAAFVAAMPTLITILSVMKALFGAIYPLILAMTMLSNAATIVAPAVTGEHNSGLDTLTTLIGQSTGASVEALRTESSVKDGQVTLTTRLRNADATPAQPVVETYLYGVDGSIVRILSQQPAISAGGTETMRETVPLPPGRYKAVTSVHAAGDYSGPASLVSALEIPGPAVSLDVALSPSQLSLGQAVQASISLTNRDVSSGTGDLAVVAQSSDGQQVKTWLVNLAAGASRHLEYGFAPQTAGGFRLRVSVSDGARLLAMRDSAYMVGDGAALAVNVAAQTVYSPSLAVALPLTVTNAGNLPGSTTFSLVTYDQASAAGPIYTAILPVNVSAGTSLVASLTMLPAALSRPGSYTALLYLGDEPYTSLDFAVEARDTLFAGIAPDKAFHHVGDIIPLTVTVLNSAFAYADASVQVSLWRPDGVTQTVAMSPANTGQYLGQVTAPISGTYVATVQVLKPDYRLVGSQAVFIVEESSQLQASIDGLAILGNTRPVTLTVSNGNGIPIVGARVVISGTHEYLSRSTNEMGQVVVQLSSVTTDTYRVELEKPGFATTLMGLPVWRVLDVTPPDLVFLTPSITRQTPYTVTGQTEAGSHLTVNDQAVAIDSQGFFTTTVALTEGPNLLVGTATDAAGNPSTITHTVTLDTVPPSLSVTSPPAGLVTTQEVVQVAGSAEVGARVLVNDLLVPVDTATGAFSARLLLKPGANTVSIMATDNAENTATVDRAVTLVGMVYLPIVMK